MNLDQDNPWPGLSPYEEDGEHFFRGREKEVAELLNRVRNEQLTILFCRSGIGKTSLLQAGLCPKLRRAEILPVLIRLEFPENVPDTDQYLRKQVRDKLADVLKEKDKELADLCKNVDELWEVFHDTKVGFLKESAPKIVLLFDQFEELFSKGNRFPQAVRAFMTELADLIENKPSTKLSRRIYGDESLIVRFDRYRQPIRAIIALRDDFLGPLERYRRQIPSIMESRMELPSLNGERALEAVLGPARLRGENSALLDQDAAKEIVRRVVEAPETASMQEINAVPSELLSLMCRELNERRKKANEERISAGSVSLNKKEILNDFYEKSFTGLPSEVRTEVRTFVERYLLSDDGIRESILKSKAINELGKLHVDEPGKVLNELVNRRLLVAESHGDRVYIELVHDVLTDTVKASRERERQRQKELERAHQKELERRHLDELERQRQEELERRRLELQDMIERLKEEWSCPTAGSRALIQNYRDKLIDPDRFRDFGEQRAIALILAAENLLYAHGYVKEGLGAAEEALRILGCSGPGFLPTIARSSNIAAAALATHGKALFEAGNFKGARRQFRKALNHLVDPTDKTRTLSWDDPFFIGILARMGIADVLGRRGYRTLAIDRYDQALALLSIEKARPGASVQNRIALYQAIILLAKSYYSTSYGFTQDCHRECDAIIKELAKIEETRRGPQNGPGKARRDSNKEASTDAYIEYLAARLAWSTGNLSFELKNAREALQELQKAFQLCRELLLRDSENWRWRSLLALIHWSLGKFYLELFKNPAEARKYFDAMLKVVQISEEQKPENLSRERPEDTSTERFEEIPQKKTEPEFIEIRYLEILARSYLAQTGEQGKKFDQKTILRDLEKLNKGAPGYATCERSIVITKGHIGDSRLNEMPGEALSHFDDALGLIFRKPKRIRNTPPFQEVAVWLQRKKGEALGKLSRVEEENDSFRKAAEISEEMAASKRMAAFEEIAASEPAVSRRLAIAGDYETSAECYLQSGDNERALFSYESAARACDLEPSFVELMDKKGSIYLASFRILMDRGDLVRSCDALEKAGAVLQQAFSHDPVNYGLCKQLEHVRANAGELEKAIAEGASKIGFETIDEIRKKMEKIKKATAWLLHPKSQDDPAWHKVPLTLIAGSWVDLTPSEQDQELKRLNDSLKSDQKFFLKDIARIRKLGLPCYDDVDLFEAEVRFQDSRLLFWAYLRAGEEKPVFLNGTSMPIHSFNQQHRLRLDSPVEAATYFRFFCGAIADKTTFRIVDSREDVMWLPSATTEPLNFQQQIYPFRLKQHPNGNWSARCTMVHDTMAFYVLMNLTGLNLTGLNLAELGKVEMDLDEKIRSLPVLAEYYVGGFRFFAPLRNDKLAEASTSEEHSGKGQAVD